MKHLYFATENDYKFKEAAVYIEKKLPLLSLDRLKIDIPEIQHNDSDEIIREKIVYISHKTSKPFIVDDASFYTQRYPGFPGSYAKFVNQTLGVDGWKKLFNEGDNIKAVAKIGLYYLGDLHIFNGEIEGVISFKNRQSKNTKTSLNDIIFIKELGMFLGQALERDDFMNHRRKALGSLCDWLSLEEKRASSEQEATNTRWNERAAKWNEIIADQDSYVNCEANYDRFNKLVEKIVPVIELNVLEVGCGTGEAGRIAKNINTSVEIIGIDTSKSMIEEAISQSKGYKGISYRVSDIAAEVLKKKRYSMVMSRGVVISHIPRMDVYDFLLNATKLVAGDGYLLFDFIQDTRKGETEIPVGKKNELKIEQIDGILYELGWVKIADDGTDDSRARVVCYNKPGKDSIYFVTSNSQKVIELLETVNDDGLDIRPLLLEIDEIKSDSTERITARKLKDAYAVVGHPVMCTDGGIFVRALNDFPGENSKQAAMKLRAKGIIKLLDGVSDRLAIRRNTLGYFNGLSLDVFTAEVPCEIAYEVREVRYPSYELDRILVPLSKDNKDRLTYCEIPVNQRVSMTELPQFADFIKQKKG
jgi:XTP/dITP diphosphohydrolase